LPAYSPELNPDEQVWNHAKARLGKCSIFNKHDMLRRLTSILRSIQKQARLIRSFFRMLDTSYILEALTLPATTFATTNTDRSSFGHTRTVDSGMFFPASYVDGIFVAIR
jgi:hypothetical protein